jgi:hypothetical protein
VLKSFSMCVVTLFFRQDVDFSSFFSLFSTPQKDPQNGLKMGLRAGHSGSIKMIMTNILVRSQAPQRMFIVIILDAIGAGCKLHVKVYTLTDGILNKSFRNSPFNIYNSWFDIICIKNELMCECSHSLCVVI